jgi:biotin operon repressor
MMASSSFVPFPAAKSRKAHARFRDGWLSRLASDPTLSGGDVAAGVILALHLNAVTRQAWPSINTIAQLTARNRTTVWRSIRRLRAAGLITTTRVGRGRYAHNRYGFTSAEDHPKTAPTHALKPSNGCTGAISMAAPAHTEPLIEPLNSNRSASRTGRNENKGAIKYYAWQGLVIHPSQAQLDKWRASYPDIPDLQAVLQKADDYYAENPPPDGKWFFWVSRWLGEDNAKHAEKLRAAERQNYSW